MSSRLAIDGCKPIRQTTLPYGRQWIGDEEVAVVETLRSDWITTGPNVAEFELALASVSGTKEAVAVSRRHGDPSRGDVCPAHRIHLASRCLLRSEDLIWETCEFMPGSSI